MFMRMFSTRDACRSRGMPASPRPSRSADQAMIVSGVRRSWVIAEKRCCFSVSSSRSRSAMRLNAIVSSAISSRPRTGMASVALRRSTSQAAARSPSRGRAILRLANPAIASDTRRLVAIASSATSRLCSSRRPASAPRRRSSALEWP